MSKNNYKKKARRNARKARETRRATRYLIDEKPTDAGNLSPAEYYTRKLRDSGLKLCDLTGSMLTDEQIAAARSYVDGDGSMVLISEDEHWKFDKLKAMGIDVMSVVTDVHDLADAC
jgi:hypothetical protein